MKHQGRIASALAIITMGVLWAAPATADTAPPPVNDNYVNSLELNKPGHKLNAVDTLKDVRDTSNATVQSDIFNPPQSGGPPENTQCQGTNFGKTIWYDFYPDRSGNVRIRTSGFDNVIALYTFSTSTFLPDNRFRCIHQGSFPTEELDASVKAGKAYTIQIGGVVDPTTGIAAGGPLEFLFDFFPTPPHRLQANTTLRASPTSNGVQLLGLSVQTARATKVKVSCGRFCRSKSKTGAATETFPNLNKVNMPAGSALTIRVTAKHSIGVFIQYNIVRGNFSKITRCTEPGSRKPRKTCH